jgi:hypothetical protein
MENKKKRVSLRLMDEKILQLRDDLNAELMKVYENNELLRSSITPIQFGVCLTSLQSRIIFGVFDVCIHPDAYFRIYNESIINKD